MKNFRPFILWILITGIAFAFWNNTVSKNSAGKKAKSNFQAEISYARKPAATNVTARKSEPEPTKVEREAPKKEPAQTKKSCVSEFAIISGYAQANLREKDDYEIIPAIFRFGFDLKPILKCANEKTMAQFAVEPFLNTAFSPNSNIETGANFLLRLGYRLFDRVSAYVECGLGFIYMTQHTREQSTQYNFTPQAGGGLYFFLNKQRSLALNVGYRRRHLSNASFKQPNKGINTDMALIGISWFFN